MPELSASSASFDVVIIGGALMGCSTAHHLLRRDPGLRVCIVERDPSYEFCASGRSFAGVRILFSHEESIRMSQYGHEFYGNFGELTKVDGEAVPLDFYRQGYLFMALNAAEAEILELNHALQARLGCVVRLLDAAGLAKVFPSLTTDDVVLAAYSPNDGWIDPHGAMMGLRRSARALGAEYRVGEVVGVEHDGRRVRAAVLKDGSRLNAEYIVNTTGAWAPEICAMLGMKIPVTPLSRMNFYFEIREQLEPLPLMRDLPGVGGRPEGRGYISGYTDFSFIGRFCFDLRHEVFEQQLWPALAHRVMAFEALKVHNAWAGHYAYNTFDGGLIIGPWIGGIENFLIATGFSGHGLQHAPAIGRGLAELIVDGEFRSIDLSRFTYQRILDDAPYPERGMRA
jgi:glycine/D-amino acid oxidase-like deaminating enzyme